MSRRPRRQFTAEQKTALVKKHLMDKVPISQLCNENDLQPKQLYDWVRQFQERAHAAFAAPQHTSSRERQLEAEVTALKAKLAKKDEVVSWLAQEHAELKKSLGQS